MNSEDFNFCIFFFFSWWQTVKQLVWSLFGMAEVSELNTADGTTKATALILYVVFLIFAVILLVNMMIALLSNTYQRVEVRIYKLYTSVPKI